LSTGIAIQLAGLALDMIAPALISGPDSAADDM
jgi:hypothetical protein